MRGLRKEERKGSVVYTKDNCFIYFQNRIRKSKIQRIITTYMRGFRCESSISCQRDTAFLRHSRQHLSNLPISKHQLIHMNVNDLYRHPITLRSHIRPMSYRDYHPVHFCCASKALTSLTVTGERLSMRCLVTKLAHHSS